MDLFILIENFLKGTNRLDPNEIERLADFDENRNPRILFETMLIFCGKQIN